MAETLVLPQSFLDEMVAHARADAPNECCGVIARFPDGALKLYRATNAEASPYRFSLPGGELHYLFSAIEGAGGHLYVIYHSHTMTEARPSPTDLNMARLHETGDPWPYWVLVSLASQPPSVRAWRVREGVAHEVGLEAGAEPAGSARVQLLSDGEARRPRVTETPLGPAAPGPTSSAG